MARVRTTLLGLAALVAVMGCTTGSYPTDVDVDGGQPREVANDCVPAVDGGEPLCASGAEDACAALVARTCEPACQEAAACVAAELTREFRPEECQAALDNELTFPACAVSPCQTLVERTCGGDEPTAVCVDNPGCQPAIVLRERATDPDAASGDIADAVAACQQALEDAVVFAPCL